MKAAFFTPSVFQPQAASAGAVVGRPVSSASWLRNLTRNKNAARPGLAFTSLADPASPRRSENDLIRQTRAGLFRR